MARSVDGQPQRLAWTKDGAGGFEAYPDGREHVDRVARIRPMTSRTGAWIWTVRCGLASDSRTADSTQEASNAANIAWTWAVLENATLQAKADREAGLLAKVDQITVEADPDVAEIFAIATADMDTLSWIMNQVRHRTRTPGIEKLIDALSRELFKFRTGERS